MQYFNNLQDKTIQDKIISLIQESANSLKIAVTWFTNHDIFEVVLKKLEIPEFQIELIVLNDRINNKNEGLNFQRLIDSGGGFYYSDIKKMVHHKFCIIDDKIIVTGSYNWTYYAEYRNWENILILDEIETVNAYIQEFDKVKQHHEKIENIKSKKRLDLSMNTGEYLISDYYYQTINEELKGNDIAVAKIYTEILRINNRPDIRKARTSIIQKINSEFFETCPFEIGIQFLNGYKKIIPAFTPLPITKKATGLDPYGNSRVLVCTIMKYDFSYQQLIQFKMGYLNPCPINTPKIEYTLTVNKDGFLTITCIELNGYGKEYMHRIDLREFQ